jgi:hypothetical protein
MYFGCIYLDAAASNRLHTVYASMTMNACSYRRSRGCDNVNLSGLRVPSCEGVRAMEDIS